MTVPDPADVGPLPVPPGFAEAVVAHHSDVAPTDALATCAAYRRFLLYLYAPSNLDAESGWPMISRWVCAAAEGVDFEVVRQRNYVARDFLEAFRRDVMPGFEWARYEMGKQARLVRRADLDPALSQAALRYCPEGPQGRVSPWTGKPWSPGAAREARRRRREAADATAARALCDDQRDILLYMNSRPHAAYARAVKRHVEEAFAVAHTTLQGEKLRAALRTLRAIEEQPQPFVGVSGRGRSARVYPAGLGMYSLKKRVRRVLTKDWVEADLTNAQLAVNAMLWRAHGVLELLEDVAFDWWRSLLELLHDRAYDHVAFVRDRPDDYARVKGALKVATYSGQFGRSSKRVREALDLALPGYPGAGRRLLSHGPFAEILAARDRHAALVNGQGFDVDAYGRRVKLSKGRDVNSLMSEVAQSYEQRLMRPVLDVAVRRPRDLDVLLWIHDGVAVRFKKRGKNENAARRAMKVGVKRVAVPLGIPTRLVFE